MIKRLTLIVFILPVLSSCTPSMPKMPSDFSNILTPYWPIINTQKNNVIQGFVFDANAFEQLQLGMDKKTVIDIIGSPSINNSFYEDQWNYIHHSTIDEEKIIHYRLTLVFENNLLSFIDESGISSLIKKTKE